MTRLTLFARAAGIIRGMLPEAMWNQENLRWFYRGNTSAGGAARRRGQADASDDRGCLVQCVDGFIRQGVGLTQPKNAVSIAQPPNSGIHEAPYRYHKHQRPHTTDACPRCGMDRSS